MRKFQLIVTALLGLLLLAASASHAQKRSITIERKDGQTAFYCSASTCFESGELQRRYDAKAEHVRSHACKPSLSSDKYCQNQKEELYAIKMCSDYCQAARCLEKNVTTGHCLNAVFR
ncbi:hypothetical protein FFI97_020500 [Variovorax sp. KBS0712]|uniref:hypothetical protein n=1 Tax=Variovorax TaxID=34072 RepID=UPI000AA2EAD3|nr:MULTISPECIES: hypothetical protein [Variovorax]TSD56594.1 hypothetical protein FFI97_020500 [Variovorax sp. KBS0712]